MDSITKKCGKCGEVKSVSEFYWKKSENVYSYACKDCIKASVKNYRESHKEEHYQRTKELLLKKQDFGKRLFLVRLCLCLYLLSYVTPKPPNPLQCFSHVRVS
jgi:hypothetical protein